MFLGLRLELQHCVTYFGAHFSTMLLDSFADAVVSAGVPRVWVLVEDLLGLPSALGIAIDLGIVFLAFDLTSVCGVIVLDIR